MNAKLLLKTVFFILILLLLVLMGMVFIELDLGSEFRLLPRTGLRS